MPVDNLIQKRIYELAEYIQLIIGEEGYVDPASVWLPVDTLGWTEAKKMSLVQFIQAMAPTGNAGVYYLNDGVPYVDQAEVFANFPLENRNIYDKVNIAGVDYWFKPDVLTLEAYIGALALADNSITPPKFAVMPAKTIYYNKEDIASIPQINTIAQLKIDLGISNNAVKQSVYEIALPASSSVAGRIAGTVEGVDYPTGWILAAGVSPVDISITHNLGRRVANISVVAITGTEEQVLLNTAAYNGWKTSNINSLLVQSLATISKAIKIYIIFK